MGHPCTHGTDRIVKDEKNGEAGAPGTNPQLGLPIPRDSGDLSPYFGSNLSSCAFAPCTAASENASVNVLLLYQASQWSM